MVKVGIYPRLGNRVISKVLGKAPSVVASPLAPSVNPLVHERQHPQVVTLDPLEVAAEPVVAIVTQKLQPKNRPPLLKLHRVADRLKPLVDDLDLGPKLLLARHAPDLEHPSPGPDDEMSETQIVKCSGLLPALLSIGPCIPAKFNQPRLVLRQANPNLANLSRTALSTRSPSPLF